MEKEGKGGKEADQEGGLNEWRRKRGKERRIEAEKEGGREIEREKESAWKADK